LEVCGTTGAHTNSPSVHHMIIVKRCYWRVLQSLGYRQLQRPRFGVRSSLQQWDGCFNDAAVLPSDTSNSVADQHVDYIRSRGGCYCDRLPMLLLGTKETNRTTAATPERVTEYLRKIRNC
jgi:hypothetical protein